MGVIGQFTVGMRGRPRRLRTLNTGLSLLALSAVFALAAARPMVSLGLLALLLLAVALLVPAALRRADARDDLDAARPRQAGGGRF